MCCNLIKAVLESGEEILFDPRDSQYDDVETAPCIELCEV